MLNLLRALYDKLFRKDLFIGKYTYGKPKIVRYGTKETAYIGKFCSIARNVTFILTGNHRTDWISTYPFPVFFKKWETARKIQGHIITKGDTVVGNDVWIGYGSLILPGITIGDGAVVGANSVVTKDVPPYAIVAGNPAKIIRKRFTEAEIVRLLKIKWWDWDDEKISKSIKLLSNNIQHLRSLEKNGKEKS